MLGSTAEMFGPIPAFRGVRTNDIYGIITVNYYWKLYEL
jgi:hypothetical protein